LRTRNPWRRNPSVDEHCPFGIEAAARQFGLHFIPVINERYFLTCHQDTLKRPEAVALKELLRSSEFKGLVASFAGYDAAQSGEISGVAEAFPEFPRRTGRPRRGRA
jgi:putative molybdopterin biosynthesis protein